MMTKCQKKCLISSHIQKMNKLANIENSLLDFSNLYIPAYRKVTLNSKYFVGYFSSNSDYNPKHT